MGFYVRKAFGKGPVRFNLSKSGLGMSVGGRGARIGVGPRGAYIAGGAGGVYYRQYQSTRSARRPRARKEQRPSSEPVKTVDESPRTPPVPAVAPQPGGYAPAICVGLFALLLLPGSPPVGLVLLGFSCWLAWSRRKRIAFFQVHQGALARLDSDSGDDVLDQIAKALQSSAFKAAEWKRFHEQKYGSAFVNLLRQGIDAEGRRLLTRVASMLGVENAMSIRTEVLRAIICKVMEDGDVTAEEEAQAEALIRDSGVDRESLAKELRLFDEFVRVRTIRELGPPVVPARIALQKAEVCHHVTSGALMDKKVLKSYTVNGQKHKEEGLVPVKEGDLYITSKRVLLVGDGASSIPHQKVMDVEVNHDEGIIEIAKDGRQKPLYIRVPDAAYTGAIIELLSTRESVVEA